MTIYNNILLILNRNNGEVIVRLVTTAQCGSGYLI